MNSRHRRAPKLVQHIARFLTVLLVLTVVVILPALFWQAGTALGLLLTALVFHRRMWSFAPRPSVRTTRARGGVR